MKQLALAATAVLLTAALSGAQEARDPNAIKSVTAGNVEVRFLNFPWDAEAFGALESGSWTRSWLIARVFSPEPLKWDGHALADGSVLVLHPAKGGEPLSFEMRKIDMRDVLTDLNVMAEPPEGETQHKAPAGFKTVEKVADRLTFGLEESEGQLQLTVSFGNRQATLALTR